MNSNHDFVPVRWLSTRWNGLRRSKCPGR